MNRLYFLLSLTSAFIVCGAVGLGSPTITFAELGKKKNNNDFSKAPIIQKLFFLTVCGKKNPGERYVTSKDGKRVCDRTSGNVWEQDL